MIAHRDIKPANVVLVQLGHSETVHQLARMSGSIRSWDARTICGRRLHVAGRHVPTEVAQPAIVSCSSCRKRWAACLARA